MIIFRRLDDNLPRDWMPGLHWQVEYHADNSDCSRPWGIAWVTAFEPGAAFPPVLDYVIVCDDCRRHGIATEIVRACRKKWPRLVLTDAISQAGEAFLASVEKR